MTLPARTDQKDISTSVEAPSGNRGQVQVTKQSANRAVLTYNPSETGSHFLTCSIRNSPARGSPFEFLVLPTKDNILLQQNEPATVVNTKAEYVVDCGIDVGDLVTFKCVGPDNKPMNCQLVSGNPTLQKYTFTPKILGEFNNLQMCQLIELLGFLSVDCVAL